MFGGPFVNATKNSGPDSDFFEFVQWNPFAGLEIVLRWFMVRLSSAKSDKTNSKVRKAFTRPRLAYPKLLDLLNFEMFQKDCSGKTRRRARYLARVSWLCSMYVARTECSDSREIIHATKELRIKRCENDWHASDGI